MIWFNKGGQKARWFVMEEKADVEDRCFDECIVAI